jgi:hypothetical protein
MALWRSPRNLLAWETILDAGMATDDYWNAVTVDRAGDVVAAGVSLDRTYDFECMFSVAKLSRASGEPIWRYDTPDCGYDEVFESSGGEEVLIDAAGDVVVGRRIIGGFGFGVYKLDGTSGALLWAVRAGDYAKHGPWVHAIALDPLGNVLTAAGLGQHGCHTDFVVSKLDAATGAERWRKTLRGTFAYDEDCEDGAFNQAQAIAVDAAGDVVVSGRLVDVPAASRFPEDRAIVLKLSGTDGAELWRRETDTYWSHAWTSVAVDSRGDVLTAWEHLSSGDEDATAAVSMEKRAGDDGRRLWSATFPGGSVGTMTTSIDEGDDVAVAWQTHAGGVPATAVVKLAGADGAVRWQREVAMRIEHVQRAMMASDPEGNVVVGGTTTQTGTPTRFLVTELAARDGAERWRYVLAGDAGRTNEVRGVAVDARNVVGVGSSEDGPTDADAVAVLIDGASGAERWRTSSPGRLPTEDGALAVALDAAGDVVAGGFQETAYDDTTSEMETAIDAFTVKKLSGTGGAVVWSRTDAELGPVTDVAVDGAGDVVAVSNAYWGAAVAKLAGVDGARLWTYPFPGGGSGPVAFGIVEDGAGRGDVVLAAFRPHTFLPWTTTLVRLAGTDGRELWNRSMEAFPPHGLVGDAAGDIVLTGGVTHTTSLIAKLAASSGEDIWTAEGPGNPTAPVIDAAGDVLVGGSVSDGSVLRHGVIKLDGGSGAVGWRTLLGAGVAVAVATDGAGDVLAVESAYRPLEGADGRPAGEFTVTKLARASGAVVWERSVANGCGAADLAIDAAGNAIVAACPPGEQSRAQALFAAVKLDGADGSLHWQRTLAGTPIADAFYSVDAGASAVVVAADGDVTLAGILATGPAETALDFAVVRWDGETGEDCCEPPPAECVDGASCVPSDACAAAGRCAGGTCVPVAATSAEVVCGLEALLRRPCDDEELPRRLRRLVRKRVKRATRYLVRAERAGIKGKSGKAIRLRDRAGSQLAVIARAAARAANADRRRQRISRVCRESIVALATDHRRHIGSLAF